MTYTKAVEKYEADKGVAVNVRTDYRCKAHGCPNAGSIEDFCYFHWRAREEPAKWGAITHMIRNDFDQYRNWGQFSPERQAMHREASQKLMRDLRDGKR